MNRTLSPAAWQELGRLLRHHRASLALALLLIATGRIAALGLPAASKYLVDEVIGRQRGDRLGLIGLLAAASVVIEALAAYGTAMVAGTAGQRAAARLRQELQARVLMLPLGTVSASTSGAMAARLMTDSEQVRYLISSGLVQLIASALTSLLALGLLFHLHALLTSAVLALVGLLALGVGRGLRQIMAAFEGVLRRQAELLGRLDQALGGIRVVKAYVAERHEAAGFARESHRLVRESVAVLRTVSFLNGGTSLAAGAVGVLVLILGGGALASGDMTLGSYVMYVWVSGLLLGPVLHLAGSSGDLGKAAAAASRIAELRQLPTESEEGSRTPVARLAGAVEFDRVSYRYQPDRLALRSISLSAPAGSTTALLGANGSGKSTLCRLLLAYDRPTSGRILIDGRDLATIARRQYRSQLGVVLQDDILFDVSIADNIRFGRPRASADEVRAAARLAHCDEFIADLPEGYATLVGDRGSRLSAGQRQRVTIARAFLVDPRILILDEATSSLDEESERLIQDALRLLCTSRTTFIAAHRLSTIRSADQVAVLERGAIADRGTASEVLARRGIHPHRGRLVGPSGGNGRGH